MALVAASPITVSRGSTEPKEVFDAVNRRLVLGVDPALSKPRYAEAICRAAGLSWDGSCDSRHTDSGGGSTVTLVGLERVLDAARVLVERRQAGVTSRGRLPTDTPLESEVRAILQVLRDRLPTSVDGKRAVTELRAADYHWRQIEWPGFYFEYQGRRALWDELGGDVGPRFGNTEFDYQLIRVFDIKTHSTGRSDALWLNDAEAIETAALRRGGIGFIIVSGEATPDDDGSFRRWHEGLKGERSQYSRDREARGAPSRPRKSRFRRTDLEVVNVRGIEGLREAVAQGWLAPKSQGRQSSGGSRRPKYQLHLSRVPAEHRHQLS